MQTLFDCSDADILKQAKDLCEGLRRKREFVDESGAKLMCMDCMTPLKGMKEAEAHNKETGHINFQEVR